MVSSQALAEQVVIRVGHSVHVGTQWLGEIASQFEELHPEIKIQLVGLPGGPLYAESLILHYISGTFPDVFWGHGDKPAYIERGWTLDLTPFLDRDGKELDLDDFLPWSLEAWAREDKQYGMPLTIDYKGLVYNAELFDQAGLAYPPTDWDSPEWTWDRMKDLARSLTQLDAAGLGERFGVDIRYQVGSWSVDIPWLFGGDWFAKDSYTEGRITGIAVDSPANVRAYSEIVDMLIARPVMPKDGASWATHTTNAFPEGKLGMEWRASWRLSLYSESLNFRWGLAPYPLAETRQNTLFVDPLFIFSETKYPEEAWEFVKFASSEACLNQIAEMLMLVPARRSAFATYARMVSEKSGLPEELIILDAMGSMGHAQPNSDIVVGFDVVAHEILEALKPVWQGTVSVEQGLQRAQQAGEVSLQDLI